MVRAMIMSSIELSNLPFFDLVSYYYALGYVIVRFLKHFSTLHEPSGTPLQELSQNYVAEVHRR